MDKKKILLLGTRSLAEEICDFLEDCPELSVTGFVENMNRRLEGETLLGYPIYWVDDIRAMIPESLGICTLATTLRTSYVEQVAAMGLRFATIAHPTARVSKRAVLGTGCLVSPCSLVSANSVLGDHVFLNRGVLIGHHTRIDSYATLQPGVNIAGCCDIGTQVFIGMGATVLDRIRIGDGAIIGAGSLVNKDVPPRSMVLGVPARVVKTDVDPR